MAIMMSVVLFSACSDKSQVLKDAVEKAKQEAGIPKTENGVTIADIRFNEATNTVEYVCELPMEVFKQFQNIAAQENYKDVFIYSKKDDASLKTLAKLLFLMSMVISSSSIRLKELTLLSNCLMIALY